MDTKTTPARTAISRGFRFVWLALIITLIAWFGAAQVVPNMVGWIPTAIKSGSMTGTHNLGDAVILDRLDTRAEKDALQVGDVITYMPEPSSPDLTTHRIIGRGSTSDGTRTFQTQGDANPTPDVYEHEITHEQIRAKVVYGVPLYGHVLIHMPDGYSYYGKFVLGGLVVLFCLKQLVGLLRPTKKKPAADAEPAAEDTNPEEPTPVEDPTAEPRTEPQLTTPASH